MMLNPNHVIDVTMQKIHEFTKTVVVQEATIKQLNEELTKATEEVKALKDNLEQAKAILLTNGLIEEPVQQS